MKLFGEAAHLLTVVRGQVFRICKEKITLKQWTNTLSFSVTTTAALVVEMSISPGNSPFQDYTNPDDQLQRSTSTPISYFNAVFECFNLKAKPSKRYLFGLLVQPKNTLLCNAQQTRNKFILSFHLFLGKLK